MESAKALGLFERELDELVGDLRVLRLPLRTVLSGLYSMVDSLFHGDRLDKKGTLPRQDAGQALISRLSYLVDLLLRCPREEIGADALDAFSPFSDDPSLLLEIQTLIQYGHFCELMPEVHRDYYTVSGSRRTGFALKHANDEVSLLEARDIVMTEVAKPFYIRPAPIPNQIIDFQVGKQRGDLFAKTVAIRYQEIGECAVEAPIITAAGFQEAIGGNVEQFNALRRAWFAIADSCLALADGFGRKARGSLRPVQDQSAFGEMLEWTAVHLKSSFVHGLIQALTGLEFDLIDSMLRLYELDPESTIPSGAGDGFFPPIWKTTPTSVMFNPDVVQRMLSSRNIAYALNKLDPSRFHDEVSSHLEPALIDEAISLLSEIDGLTVERNIRWSCGEMDVLAYEPTTNTALHVQAKGAIPAQGARMVQAMESRTREGLRQLRAFRDLSDTARDRELSNVLKRAVEGVEVIDMLLLRGGIGSWKVWHEVGTTIAANLPLLRGALDRNPAGSGIRRIVRSIPQFLDEIVQETTRGWLTKSMTLADAKVSFPVLDLDEESIAAVRARHAPTQIMSNIGPRQAVDWNRLARSWESSDPSVSSRYPEATRNRERSAGTRKGTSKKKDADKRRRKLARESRKRNRRK